MRLWYEPKCSVRPSKQTARAVRVCLWLSSVVHSLDPARKRLPHRRKQPLAASGRGLGIVASNLVGALGEQPLEHDTGQQAVQIRRAATVTTQQNLPLAQPDLLRGRAGRADARIQIRLRHVRPATRSMSFPSRHRYGLYLVSFDSHASRAFDELFERQFCVSASVVGIHGVFYPGAAYTNCTELCACLPICCFQLPEYEGV